MPSGDQATATTACEVSLGFWVCPSSKSILRVAVSQPLMSDSLPAVANHLPSDERAMFQIQSTWASMLASSLRSTMSQTLSVPSQAPLSSFLPPLAKAKAETMRRRGSAGCTTLPRSSPDSKDQSLMLPAKSPTAMTPSGEQAIDSHPLTPDRVRTFSPSATFHTRTVASRPAETSCLPSAEKVMPSAASVCPVSTRSFSFLTTSQRQIVLSRPPLASSLLSGENATLLMPLCRSAGPKWSFQVATIFRSAAWNNSNVPL